MDVENGTETLQKKIRNAEIAQYNFIFGSHVSFNLPTALINSTNTVVGQVEFDSKSVNVRNRDDVGTKARSTDVPLETIKKQLVALKKSQDINNVLPPV